MESIRLTHDLGPYRTELERACAADVLFNLTFAQLAEGVQDGTFLAVDVAGEGCAVLEIRETRGHKVLSVVALGGWDMSHWLGRLFAFVERLAADQKCVGILAVGRPGWARALRPFGFCVQEIAMFRGLS